MKACINNVYKECNTHIFVQALVVISPTTIRQASRASNVEAAFVSGRFRVIGLSTRLVGVFVKLELLSRHRRPAGLGAESPPY